VGIFEMSKFLRLTALGAAVATLTATQAGAATSSTAVTATKDANAHAKIMRPLQLTSTQDLDFGTLVISGTGTQVMHLDQSAALTGCGTVITCSGTPQDAIYQVKGTPNATVTVTVTSPVVLTNANDGTKLNLTPDAPATVVLDTAAPTTGDNFNIGGSITIDSAATTDGVYNGTFAVSVDYQ
jgi:hypothetical protein